MDAALGLRNENQDMFTVLEELLGDFVGVHMGPSSDGVSGPAEHSRMQALRMLCQKVDARCAILRTSQQRKGTAEHWGLLYRLTTTVQSCVKENFRLNSHLGEMRAALTEASNATETALGNHRRQESKLHILKSELDTSDRLVRNVSVQLAQGIRETGARKVPEVPSAPTGAQPSEKRQLLLAHLCTVASTAGQHAMDGHVRIRKQDQTLARMSKELNRVRAREGTGRDNRDSGGGGGSPNKELRGVEEGERLQGPWTSPRKANGGGGMDMSFSFET